MKPTTPEEIDKARQERKERKLRQAGYFNVQLNERVNRYERRKYVTKKRLESRKKNRKNQIEGAENELDSDG